MENDCSLPAESAACIDERQLSIMTTGKNKSRIHCADDSLAGAVSQRACVFCGARVVLNPVTDAVHLVHGPIGCASYTWDIRGSLSSGSEMFRQSFSTDLKEKDVVFGGEPKLAACIDEIVEKYHPPAIFVYSTCVVGMIGDDTFGQAIEASLREEGIDTSEMVVRRNGASQFAFIAVEPDAGRRTIFWQRPTGRPLQPEEVPLDKIRQAAVLHTDGLFIDASLLACRTARQAGVPVVVDAGTLRDGMLELARLSDYFIASETFARQMVGNRDPLAACALLLEQGPRLAAVTLGAAGYAALCDGKVIRQPAYPVNALDTTGCGDVFHAGFIFGLVQSWDYGLCLDFAAWAAAQVSLEMGGRRGIPSLAGIKRQGYPVSI